MSTALQTTQSQTLTPEPLLDAKLSALVRSSDSPIVGPDSAKALEAFSQQPEPPLPKKEQVEIMIGKLAIATAQSKVSDQEAEARLDLYWLALSDVPVVDLRKGFENLVKTATFLPTPAEVRKASVIFGAQRRHEKGRARYLAWKHRMEWIAPVTEFISADELASLKTTPDASK